MFICLHIPSFISNWGPSFRSFRGLHLQLYVRLLADTDEAFLADSQDENIVIGIRCISWFRRGGFRSNRYCRFFPVAIIKETRYFENHRLAAKLRWIATILNRTFRWLKN